MKLFILLATLLTLSTADERFRVDFYGVDFKNLEFDLDRQFVEDFFRKYEISQLERDDAGITAVINEYADKLFTNIEAFSISNGLDPVNITNVGGEFLTFQLRLTNGLLNGISTISRSEKDVEMQYHSSTKEMELYLPILFSNLNFTYDYHLIILIVGPSGSITGVINNFEMDIRLSFDFNTYHAKVLDVITTDTGHIDLIFHGNGVVDDVVDAISEFVTTVLHPLIVRIIQDIVTNIADTVVETVNNAIDSVLFPTPSPEDVALVL